MGNYLNQTGRPIVFSCSWPAYQEPLNITVNIISHAQTIVFRFCTFLVELHCIG